MMWKLIQWKKCDGVGCCDRVGLFTEKKEHGKCKFWTGDRCMLMLDNKLQDNLSSAEQRAFNHFCMSWPQDMVDLNKEYTDEEMKATRLTFDKECCWRWVKTQ